jgi:hypothetical protein
MVSFIPLPTFQKRYSTAKCNYEIYDKELIAIIDTFEEWRPELQSMINPIHILSEHKNLEYFPTIMLLN